MRVPGRLIGLGVGLVAGLILILAGWKVFLILLAFGSLGFFVGAYLESREDLTKRIRAFFDRLFGAG